MITSVIVQKFELPIIYGAMISSTIYFFLNEINYYDFEKYLDYINGAV